MKRVVAESMDAETRDYLGTKEHWRFSPESAEDFGGFEGIAQRILDALADPEIYEYADVDEVFEIDGELIVTFPDGSSERTFANEVIV